MLNIQLIIAPPESQQVIANLMQFYMYDFSGFTGSDVEPNGLFAEYPHLEDYWKGDNHRFPYIILGDGIFIGFVLVRLIETEEKTYFSIAEFFVMQMYRRQGIGRIVVNLVLDLHRGAWEVFQMEVNKPAQEFWRQIVREYTRGKFRERVENKRTIQSFEN
jgi:predicted acetyltransferase